MSRIRRRQFLIAAGVLAVMPLGAAAQPLAKIPRVGVLSALPLSSMMFPRQFPDALRELGYVDKQNIILDWRTADGRFERLPALAADLVESKPDLVVAIIIPDILAAKRATGTIPIVMVGSTDPVATGLVASLARPGGNVTGRTHAAPETLGKQLEVLKETVPTITRVVLLLGLMGAPALEAILKGYATGAQALGLALHAVEVRPTDDVACALEEVRRWQPDALYVGAGFPAGHRDAILKFTVQLRLPTMSPTRGMVEAGALMVYTPSALEAARRTAWYVDRILKGAKPADLPVELPQKHDLVINLKTAKAIGLTIPQSILLRADEVIE